MALGDSAAAARGPWGRAPDVGSWRRPRSKHRRHGRAALCAGRARAQAAPRSKSGPPRGEAGPAPAPPPAGGATPGPRVRARPRATRLGVRGAAAEAGPGGRQKMARVCRRQQCSVERRGFRQELDSWRHKLIHCVGETLSRQPSALGPPHCRPPRRREGGSRDRAIAAPARPPSLAWRPPPPPPGVRARATSGRALPARARARAPAPPLRAPFPGRALGRERVPLLSSPSLPPSIPAWRPGAAAGLLWRLAPRRCHWSRSGAAAGPAKPTAGARGVLGRGSASRSALAGAFRVPRSPSPTRGRGARPCPRVHGRRAGGRPALGRVRSVRWRWGRREPELSQAPGPPDRAKWGVMAAGGSGCTSSAGGGGGSGRGVNPRRSGRCVCVFLFGVCAAGGRGMEPGATGKPEQWSCPLLGDFPQPPLGRAPCPPPASRTSGRLGWLFPRGQRERGRGRPGRGRAAEQRLSHCVFCLFFSPKVPFPSVRRPAGP